MSVILTLSACEVPTSGIVYYVKEGMFVPQTENSSSSVSPAEPIEIEELIPNEQGMIIDDHVEFSIGDLDLHVRKETYDVKPMIEALVAPNGQRCGETFTDSYKARLLDAYAAGEHIVYTVYDPAVLVQPDFYYIELIPNAMRYATLDAAGTDMNICAVESIWVLTINQKWILFNHSACGRVSMNGDVCGKLEEIMSYHIRLR